MKIDDVYLGDGVYASFDGYHIWLDLRGQDSTTRIALEPQTMIALISYNERVQRDIRNALAAAPASKEASK